MLKIEHLTKIYPNGKKAVNDLSLTIQAGDIYGFIGANGAGNTSTIKAVVDIHEFDQGEIYINGKSIRKDPLQCKKELAYIPDNQYYLKHLFNGKWDSSGCIFLDSRNAPDFSDRHSIIYGHHMKNGTMFSGLTQYKKQEFYQAHPTILLITPEQNIRVEIFAGYVANVKDDAWETALEPDTKFEAWLEAARSRSCFESDMIPAVTDRIVTLSTCSYEFDNARFVLLGIVQ